MSSTSTVTSTEASDLLITRKIGILNKIILKLHYKTTERNRENNEEQILQLLSRIEQKSCTRDDSDNDNNNKNKNNVITNLHQVINETQIGFTVNKVLKKHANAEIARKAKSIVIKWREILHTDKKKNRKNNNRNDNNNRNVNRDHIRNHIRNDNRDDNANVHRNIIHQSSVAAVEISTSSASSSASSSRTASPTTPPTAELTQGANEEDSFSVASNNDTDNNNDNDTTFPSRVRPPPTNMQYCSSVSSTNATNATSTSATSASTTQRQQNRHQHQQEQLTDHEKMMIRRRVLKKGYDVAFCCYICKCSPERKEKYGYVSFFILNSI
jgi:hypothetical protein